jgi:hypothetical protein
VQAKPFLDLSSGYVQRAGAVLPKQGTASPWNLTQNYFKDWWMLKQGAMADGTLVFARRSSL